MDGGGYISNQIKIKNARKRLGLRRKSHTSGAVKE
jgi:hypothetical protein